MILRSLKLMYRRGLIILRLCPFKFFHHCNIVRQFLQKKWNFRLVKSLPWTRLLQLNCTMLTYAICNSINLKWFLLDWRRKTLVSRHVLLIDLKGDSNIIFRLWITHMEAHVRTHTHTHFFTRIAKFRNNIIIYNNTHR